MYDVILLHTGLFEELTAHTARKAGTALLEGLEAKIDAYDARHPIVEPCTKSLICQREGTRHRKDCPGRTLPIDIYARGLQNV